MSARAYRRLTSEGQIASVSRLVPPQPPPQPVRQKRDIYVSSSVIAPPPGTIVLLSYLVEIGHIFALTGLMLRFAPENIWVPGDGSITWILDVNKPLVASPYALGGRPLQGLSAENAPVGNYDRPWLFQEPRVFSASDFIQLKVVTTAAIPPDSGYFNSRFVGYLWPAEE